MSAGVYVEEAKLMGLEDPMAIVDYVSKRQAEEREKNERGSVSVKRRKEKSGTGSQMKIEEEERNRRHQLEMVRVQTETNGGSPAQPSTLPHIRLPALKKSLFEGKPLEILHRLDASDKTYLSMKSALMRAYGLTVDEAKLQFNRAMMQDKETAAQFLVRLSGYLDQWLEKDGTPNTKEGLRDLVLRSQLEKSCPQDLVAQFKIHKTKTAEQMADKADAHFSAFGYHTRKQWKKPVSSLGSVGGVRVSVLRDNGSSGCVVKRRLCRHYQKHGEEEGELTPLTSVSDLINSQDIVQEQKSDSSLESVRRKLAEKSLNRSFNEETCFIERNKRIYRRVLALNGEERLQFVVPARYRLAVFRLGHHSALGGHMGQKKTLDRIQAEFFWPGMGQEISRLVRSCDICQKTSDRGRVKPAPLKPMPLISEPFERVAVDIVGPIHPRASDGCKYILTLVDFSTRWPEAVPLRNIDAVTVAEAMVEIFCRIGIPRQVLSDRGTQFTSAMMEEVLRLLSIKGLKTTPYHPMCNGLCERFNGTLKKMLKRMAAEQPKEWPRYLAPLLFAYREVPQSSLKFSPFELVYGRTVRGPLQILRELWDDSGVDIEVKTTYTYVIDLANRLQSTCDLAKQELLKAQETQKAYYDRKAKKTSKLGSTSTTTYICAAAVIPESECDDGPVTAQSWQTETIDNVKFRVLPFGLSNSPAVFNRVMRQVLQGVKGVEAFIDDILVHSSTFEEHLKILEEVFQRLRCANMTVKPNASQDGVGAVLMQETDGEIYPVAYHSRKLKSAERNYSTVEKELLAVVDGIKKYYFYLYGDKFLLETDHMPLESLRTSKNANARLMRWAMYLQQFNFAIRYIKGSANVGADFLSRLVENNWQDSEESLRSDQRGAQLCDGTKCMSR
ncbi:putative uncharacterized protein K02A2.6-like [Penaeus vannamei]|uniref:RNA-directed DNA polymerase n=1 Tax=Penaeus vannamei TaxID=6689 RepID=A0A3R7PU43_PENVA|nr:putative uncharacterized protein K02A2.6-like [Penaeus vannamei]